MPDSHACAGGSSPPTCSMALAAEARSSRRRNPTASENQRVPRAGLVESCASSVIRCLGSLDLNTARSAEATRVLWCGKGGVCVCARTRVGVCAHTSKRETVVGLWHAN
jgi:hypothetical protein